MSLYTIILIGSISIPFLLSFDKKLQFYKQWKYLLPSIIIIALFYIVGDIYFTKLKIWGFNQKYLSSIFIFRLPKVPFTKQYLKTIVYLLFYNCISYSFVQPRQVIHSIHIDGFYSCHFYFIFRQV